MPVDGRESFLGLVAHPVAFAVGIQELVLPVHEGVVGLLLKKVWKRFFRKLVPKALVKLFLTSLFIACFGKG